MQILGRTATIAFLQDRTKSNQIPGLKEENGFPKQLQSQLPAKLLPIFHFIMKMIPQKSKYLTARKQIRTDITKMHTHSKGEKQLN